MGTLAACSLAMCRLRTRPWTDVDPPRVELPPAGGGAYHLAAPWAITCIITVAVQFLFSWLGFPDLLQDVLDC